MSLLDKSPVGKKGRYDDNSNISGSQTSDKGGFKVIGELTDIDCPDQKCHEGKFLKKKGAKNTFYYVCNQPGCNVTASCLYTPSNIAKDEEDGSGRCRSCFQYVYEKLSVGKCLDASKKRECDVELRMYDFSPRFGVELPMYDFPPLFFNR